MIMLSQDENTIVNFDNVENIQVRKLPVNETGYAISVETFCSNFDRFAIYDTEERAKEVLIDILEHYNVLIKNIAYAASDKDCIINYENYFEMPKE